MHKPVELFVEERGKGPLPLMLVHGFPLDHTIWDEVAAILASDTRLLLPDLRGYGRSPIPGGVYRMEDMALDLKTLLDRLEIERVVLAGHSMGGYVGLAFAEAFPERLAGLAMVASAAAADAPDRKAGRLKQAEEVAKVGPAALEGMLERYSPSIAVRQRVSGWLQRSAPQAIQGSLLGMAERPDRMGILQYLQVPLAVLTGDQDILIPIERSREMAAGAEYARYSVLTGGGHMPMLEDPAWTAAVLREFVADCQAEI